MIIKSSYDEKEFVDKVWYQSSSLYFSKFIENKNDNNGQLYVTFKNGSTYWYKDVDMVHDYMMFKNGALDGSQGKSLNKYIKPTYEFERVEDADISKLEKELRCLKELENKENTYFIFGNKKTKPEFFEQYYQPALDNIIEMNSDAKFVIGDKDGVDIMAQNYLINVLSIDPLKITVYYSGNTPDFLNENIKNIVTGFDNNELADEAMSKASLNDIVFISKDEKTDDNVSKNILRRHFVD